MHAMRQCSPRLVLAVPFGALLALVAAVCVTQADFDQHEDEAPPPEIVGLVDDWTSQHVGFTATDDPEVQETTRQDPRYWLQQLKRRGAAGAPGSADGGGRFPSAGLLAASVPALFASPPTATNAGWGVPAFSPNKKGGLITDWSESLGAGGTAVATYPAKYAFTVGTPSCSDFVVFAVNTAGSASQPSIVGFTNLYPSCGGTVPTVLFALNTNARQSVYNLGVTASSGIDTSPALSLDGTEVAYVENSNHPVFHVLTIDPTGSSNGTLTTPVVPCTINGTTSCTSNHFSERAFVYAAGASSTTRSSPFVDYDHDDAYVGADDGNLYSIHPVFGAGPPQVVSGWPLSVSGATGGPILTSAVRDFMTQRIFIGTSTGFLRMVRVATGDPCTGAVAPPCVDTSVVKLNAGGSNAMFDGPLVDSTNQTVFAFNNNNGASAFTVTQVTTALGCPSGATCPASASCPSGLTCTNGNIATVGTSVGGAGSAYIGAFDQAYFTSPSSGHLYVCGTKSQSPANNNRALWAIGFGQNGVAAATMSSGTPSASNGGAGSLQIGTNNMCSPLTEIFNASTAKDFLFASVSTGSGTCSGGCIHSFNISSGFPGAADTTVAEAGGTSAIVIDNASSISADNNTYFSPLSAQLCPTSGGSGICAIQATQPTQ